MLGAPDTSSETQVDTGQRTSCAAALGVSLMPAISGGQHQTSVETL